MVLHTQILFRWTDRIVEHRLAEGLFRRLYLIRVLDEYLRKIVVVGNNYNYS